MTFKKLNLSGTIIGSLGSLLFKSISKVELLSTFLQLRHDKILNNIDPKTDIIIPTLFAHKRIIEATFTLSPLLANYFDTMEIKIERISYKTDEIYSEFLTTNDNISLTLKTINYSPDYEQLRTFWFDIIEYVGICRKKSTMSDEYIK